MNKKMLLIFSHKLTKSQIEDAISTIGVNEFVDLPQNLKAKWSSIDPSLDDLTDVLNNFKVWIKDSSSPSDYVLIQGDFGACYHLVNYAKSLSLIPIYSTTHRVAEEYINKNGEVVTEHKFSHVKYRKY